MFWTYILRCGDGSLYVGHTDNLEKRVSDHSRGGGCEYTRKRLPVELVWTSEFPTREDAFLRERQIKSWSRAKKEALITENWSVMRAIHLDGNRSQRMRQKLIAAEWEARSK